MTAADSPDPSLNYPSEGHRLHRPRGVFISSRMIELSLDRAVAYRAVALAGLEPVLFEREPQTAADMTGVLRINSMITHCRQFIGLYYRGRGDASRLFNPWSPIEYELIGHLSKNAQVSRPDWQDPARRSDAKCARLVARLQRHYANVPARTAYIFLKTSRRIDGPGSDPGIAASFKGPPTNRQIADFFKDTPMLKGTLLPKVIPTSVRRDNIRIYHSTSRLHELVSTLMRPPKRESLKTYRFRLALHGPDWTGLLVRVTAHMLDIGANIEQIEQISDQGQFFLVITGTVHKPRVSAEQTEHYLQDVANRVMRELRAEGPSDLPNPWDATYPPYESSMKIVKAAMTDNRIMMTMSVVDTPGILHEIATVLKERQLGIASISLGSAVSYGMPQTHIHLLCCGKEGIDQRGYAVIENDLISLIGVNSIHITPWSEASRMHRIGEVHDKKHS